jgi:cell division protein FtsL
MNLAAYIAIALLGVMLVLLIAVVAVTQWWKKKVFIHHVRTYDVKGYPEDYFGWLTGDKKPNQIPEYLCVAEKKFGNMLRAYVMRKPALVAEKPDDMYIRKGRNAEHYLQFRMENRNLRPILLKDDDTLQATQSDEEIRKASFLVAQDKINQFTGAQKTGLLTVVVVIVVMIMMLIAMVFTFNFIQGAVSDVATQMIQAQEKQAERDNRLTDVLERLTPLLERQSCAAPDAPPEAR